MAKGQCKLCLRTADLQMSHFIPKAMFKYIRDPAAPNPNPLVVTSKGPKVVVKQIVAAAAVLGLRTTV
jgi:hypothetical protein